MSDAESAKYVYGMAVHWYESTFRVYEETLDKVHGRFPEFSIIHTEGTIDDLGKDVWDKAGTGALITGDDLALTSGAGDYAWGIWRWGRGTE